MVRLTRLLRFGITTPASIKPYQLCFAVLDGSETWKSLPVPKCRNSLP